MAVLTQNKQRPHKGPVVIPWPCPLVGYTNFAGGNVTEEIYEGSVLVSDVSDLDGYFRACPAGATTNSHAADIFGGISLERVSVTSSDTSDGSKEAVAASNGWWGFAVGSLTAADTGLPAYASDDDTISTTSANNYWCGYILGVDATYIWINIGKAFMLLNAATQ